MILAIAKICKLDKEAREIGLNELAKVRQKEIKAIVNELFKWLRNFKKTVIESDAYYKGVVYALNQETALKQFLSDPCLEIDNSRVERGMKRIAIGRRIGFLQGAQQEQNEQQRFTRSF